MPGAAPGAAGQGFQPAGQQYRVGGAQVGLNPFGETMAPELPRMEAPSPFAATAPPPTAEEHERAVAAGLAPAVAAHAAHAGGYAPAAHAHGGPMPPGQPMHGAPPAPFGAPPGPPPGFAAAGAPSPQPPAGARPSSPDTPAAQPAQPAPEPGADPLEVRPDAPRVLAGFLVSYEGADLGTFWPLFQGKNAIGRKDAAEGLDIPIDNATTSSRHAVLHASARPGRLKLEDGGSTNGTFVNDERLARGQPRELKDGDRLRFGAFAATVKIIA